MGVKFADLNLSANTMRGLTEGLGYEMCTDVQAKAIPACQAGTDVVCKAKTGTGKTLAFLIPAVEQLMRAGPRKGTTAILVISPTRELASQIAVEAKALCSFHHLTYQVMVGGTNQKADLAKMRQNPPDILVATPGRLNDNLTDPAVSQALGGIRTLIFDEADRLLDMGFRPAIDQLLKALPGRDARQTVLFSATFPSDIKSLASYALRPGYQMVDTVGESAQQTADKVEQWHMSCPMDHHLAAMLHILKTHQKEDRDFKVIAFFTTARLTQLYSELFLQLGMPVVEMHSRKSQSARTKAALQFRDGKQVMMFTSDVSARGVDYPDVSLVLQVGLPTDRSQYIHRVGRTARAGKQGKGVLLLCDFESPSFMRQLKDVTVKNIPAFPESTISTIQPTIDEALQGVSADTKASAYRTWLGFYKGFAGKLGWQPEELVQQANYFATDIIGHDGVPTIEKKTVGKMGMRGVPGFNYGVGGSSTFRGGGGGGRPGGGRGGRPGAPRVRTPVIHKPTLDRYHYSSGVSGCRVDN